MSNRHQELASRIVENFQDSLDENIRQQIPDNQFNVLTLMIREALGNELSTAAERIESVVRGLRAESDKPELGM